MKYDTDFEATLDAAVEHAYQAQRLVNTYVQRVAGEPGMDEMKRLKEVSYWLEESASDVAFIINHWKDR